MSLSESGPGYGQRQEAWHSSCINYRGRPGRRSQEGNVFPQQENLLLRRTTMKQRSWFLTLSLFITAAVAAGCASTPPKGTAFTGEVWTWDEQTNTVTLRQGGRDIRVIIDTDQIDKLKLHEIKKVHGELATPKDIQVVMVD